jgi:hypothetical protein
VLEPDQFGRASGQPIKHDPNSQVDIWYRTCCGYAL